jgi:hypothetical protein
MVAHRETVHWPLWSHLAAGAAILFLVGGSAGLLVRGAGAAAAALAFASAAVIGAVWWRMRHLALEFGPGGAAFGFGGPRRRVPRERVVSADVEAYSWARYMGWGYRIGWKPRDRAYSLPGTGRGVRLVFDDERGRRWSVFLSSASPEAAVQALGE